MCHKDTITYYSNVTDLSLLRVGAGRTQKGSGGGG